MKNLNSLVLILSILFTLFLSCKQSSKKVEKDQIVKNVDASLFLTNNSLTIDTVNCTLSDGTKTKCFQITTFSIPEDHEMGPWCPHTINDSAEKGGIWFKDGKMYDVDGEFIKELPKLYHDDFWKLYDNNGDVFRTKSEDDCIKLMGAQLQDKFINYCIECLPKYVSNLSSKYLIPITPVKLETPINLSGDPKGGNPPNGDGENPPGEERDGPPRDKISDGERPNGPPPGNNEGERPGGPIKRGIAFNGVIFDAPAPLHIILKGYTIPPIDDAGGHINMDNGYHYHAATGKTKEHEQHDHHAPMIGYAMDGFGLYAQLNTDGHEPEDLDDCRGHYDDIRGYHYHVDAAGNNNFINCFSGAIVK